jgi:hypothetical protein
MKFGNIIEIEWINQEVLVNMLDDDAKLFLKKKFYSKSSFQKKFNLELFEVSTEKTLWNIKFKKSLLDFLFQKKLIKDKNIDLKNLHKIVDKKYFVCETKGKDNNSRPLISDISFDFLAYNNQMYLDFLKFVYQDLIKEDFYFQKTPTIRFHIPNYNKHLQLPAWHCDPILGHSPSEVNIWFSLTDNIHSDFWIGDLKNSRNWLNEYDFNFDLWKSICFNENDKFIKKGFEFCKPVENIENKVFFFDSRCIHAATYRDNKDLTTKVSIDLRIILKKDFEWVIINNKPLYVGDGIKKAEFRPGHEFGYHEKSIEELL